MDLRLPGMTVVWEQAFPPSVAQRTGPEGASIVWAAAWVTMLYHDLTLEGSGEFTQRPGSVCDKRNCGEKTRLTGPDLYLALNSRY